MELYIVLAIMAFMIVGFLLNKWPFGLTTMTCCVLLALTGVFTIPEAFAGFCQQDPDPAGRYVRHGLCIPEDQRRG